MEFVVFGGVVVFVFVGFVIFVGGMVGYDWNWGDVGVVLGGVGFGVVSDVVNEDNEVGYGFFFDWVFWVYFGCKFE